MGWWRIDCASSGHINKERNPETGTCNAMPGESHRENHYNGDRPADIMDEHIPEILGLCQGENVSISPDEMKRLFISRVTPNSCSEPLRSQLLAVVDKVSQLLTIAYFEAWQRPPYPEELAAVCNFSINPHKFPS